MRRKLLPVEELHALISSSCCIVAPAEPGWHNDRTRRIPITIHSQGAYSPSHPPDIDLDSPPQAIRLRTSLELQPYTDIRHRMDPTVILLSPYPLRSHSIFEVSRLKKPYITAKTELLPDGLYQGKHRYTTFVAADHWGTICNTGK